MRRPESIWAACSVDSLHSHFDPHLHPTLTADAPGHARRVVREAVAPIRAEQDDATVTAEAAEEIGDCGFGGNVRSVAGKDTVDSPLAENQLHDGFAPSG